MRRSEAAREWATLAWAIAIGALYAFSMARERLPAVARFFRSILG